MMQTTKALRGLTSKRNRTAINPVGDRRPRSIRHPAPEFLGEVWVNERG